MMNLERVKTVVEIVKEAGSIALRYFGRTESRLKADNSLVTEADVEIGKFLSRRLHLNFPDYAIINEENFKSVEDLPPSSYTWVLDPIDGTSSFSSRLPVWGVAVGLMRGFEPVMGVIYLPLMDELYYTDEGLPSFFETQRWGKIKMDISGQAKPLDKHSFLCTVSYAHRRLNIDFPGKSRSLGSAAAHFCYVARGDAAGAVIQGALWDMVPGWSILKNAGGDCRFLDGSNLSLRDMTDGKPSQTFLIASSPLHLQDLLQNISVKS